MTEPRHILGSFNDALEALHTDALTMAALAERNLRNALQGLFTGSEALCQAAIADDEDVDQLEKRIDEDGLGILLRFQPVATDLRQVVSAIKLIADLERVGDQAVNIARKARKLCTEPERPLLTLLQPPADLALELFRDSVRAYAEADVELALSIRNRDKELDRLNAALDERLTDEIKRSRSSVRLFLSMIQISGHLERVGDHAKNIAEDAVFVSSAEDIRHRHEA